MVLETQAGFVGAAWFEMEMSGTWDIHCYLDESRVGRPKGICLRGADATVEVGPIDSTLSTGELCTRGSDGAGVDLTKGHSDHTQRWSTIENKT